MSISLKDFGLRRGMKVKLIAAATTLTLSGVAALVPFTALADHTNAHTIEQLTAQIAALQAELAKLAASSVSAPAAAAECSFTRTLSQGVRGDDVRCLQEYLNGAGYEVAVSGPGSPGNETTFFGSLTRAAVAKWQAANDVSPAVGYFGPISRAKYNSIAVATPAPTPTPTPTPVPGVTPTPTPTPVGSGLTVAAAADQPPSQLAPLGATRVPFTKFVLTAAADGDVTVKSVTAERQGAADDDAFDNVAVLDQDGAQIGLTKTLNSAHQAIFTEPIVVKAGTSRTITLAGKMLDSAPSSSNAGQVARLALVAIDAGTSKVTGALPIVGNGMTINESLTIGTVTMARGSFDPGAAQTKEVGTPAYTFSSIKVTAGSAEKVYLSSIRWNQTGSAGSGDIANVKTIIEGVEYPLAVSSDGKYYTSVFPENAGKGLLIDKGFSKDVTIKGDIAGGSSRTIAFDLAKRTDLGLTGDTYTFGITPPQTNSCGATTGTACFTSAEDPWYDGAVVTISAGTMTVSTSNALPAQNIGLSVPNQPLGSFTVDVKGEIISVAKLGFNVTLGAEDADSDVNDFTNVTLVDENGAVIAGPVDGNASDTTDTAASADGVIVFSSTVNFPIGIHTYKLLGKVGTDIANNTTFQASTTPSSDFATVRGLVTGNTITPSPSSAISLNTMTVKAGSLTISVSSVPIAQTIISGSKAFTFANYILDATASGEDVRIVNVPLEYNNPTGGTANRLSNCQIFDSATSITSGGNVINPSAIGSSTSFTFDGNGLILPKGSSKTLALKCDLAGGAVGGYQWGVANNASTFTGATGVTSGQTVTETFNASAGQAMTSASGGSMAVVLDANSPGYQVWYAGQTNVELARFRFSAVNEDIDLRQVALQFSRTASNSPVNLVARKVTLWNVENKQIGEATFATQDNATSSLIAVGDFKILRDVPKILVVRGDLAAIGVSGPNTFSSDFLTVDYDGTNVGLNGNYGTGASSGTTINGGSTDTAANGGRIFKAYPKLAYVSLSTAERSLTPGTTPDKVLYKFSVQAIGGDVAIAKFTFLVSSSTAPATAAGATTSLYSLYSYTDSAYGNPDTAFSADGLLNSGQCWNGRSTTGAGSAGGILNLGGPVTGGSGNTVEIWMERAQSSCNTATTTYTIGSGQTRYFRFAATVASVEGVAGQESFTVQLEGDSAFPTTHQDQGSDEGGGDMGKIGAFFGPAGINASAQNDLIWSPISTTTSITNSDFDYTNGYLMPGLPPTNMTVETLTSPN